VQAPHVAVDHRKAEFDLSPLALNRGEASTDLFERYVFVFSRARCDFPTLPRSLM
jgi:hypothetical protein